MAQKTPFIVLLSIITIIGITARVFDFGGHFVHVDDLGVAKTILDYKSVGEPAIFAVPLHWTYAPFQFLLTQALVNFDQNYKEILFWGRLPSVVFATLGLFAFILFFRKYKQSKASQSLFGLTLLICSHEAIIAARQMHNYSLGLTAAIAGMIVFIWIVQQEKWALQKILLSSAVLALLTYMQYSFVLFLPAFFIGLLVYGFKRRARRLVIFRDLVLGGVLYLGLIFPAYYYFLRRQFSEGKTGLYSWNKGVEEEFFFHWPQASSFLAKAIYAVTFYAKNLFIVFTSNLGFFSERHMLFLPAMCLLFVLFIFGCVDYFKTSDQNKRYLGIYFGIVVLTWCVLIFAGRLTMSPTRHNLILLPLMAVTTAQGVEVFFRRWKWFNPAALSLIVVLIFTFSYKTFLIERKDPFVEKEILGLVDQHQVDSIVASSWTLHLEMMKSIRERFDAYEKGFRRHYVMSKEAQPYKRVLWISQVHALDKDSYEKTAEEINKYLYVTNRLRGQKAPLIQHPLEAYKIVYSKEVPSNTGFEFSQKTFNCNNGLYMYVLERRF